MNTRRGTKLNRLQHILPEGLVADASWLEAKGYSSSLRSKYLTGGWLEQPARGVYRRPSGELRWQQVVISLQTLLDYPVIVGGRTALELSGFAHYLTHKGPREVHLYGDALPPGWLTKLDLEPSFVFHNAKKLFREEPIARGLSSFRWNLKTNKGANADPIHGSFIQRPSGHWDWPLTLSTPERAILELLDEVPKHETFHQADVFMDGLRSLSPRRLQKLLADCRSVKVKRLFLWFAERHGHAWLKRIDHDAIDLGHGKRMLIRGGKLDPKYLITVPEDIDGGG